MSSRRASGRIAAAMFWAAIAGAVSLAGGAKPLGEARRHFGDGGRRNRALVGTADDAGDIPAHADAVFLCRLDDRAEAFQALGDGAVDVLLREGLGGGGEDGDLLDA